ncbi:MULTISPECIES: helix-turn-helix domain-containing protein [unclassified Microbacterium]|uniref:winged helix-turn-helix transcriptional regulator n=1 Tax=unclassified Microbacterium TaxID=2609290 RepID=UPI000CFC6113|nr:MULTISPECIES: helix-turn-helix domain-containing protein [unclassified Microbacterium]PQZ55421.1 ArsR family transcriptional regulator [Microbacterium sp. MYb43]PQZ76352.1 ArsR family transcriptional regulator [Microbacterium sp. MYb40]PRB21202.1 ArsR family transcriptional regulator [Microbacterium sp. MYb54]PRB26384.1 ArsR family transcriptional regulator [Microbacterium sp. MYb50]PRB67023.1 ArsR family transcriptional regulator [Microbacterium sp. MYb24]
MAEVDEERQVCDVAVTLAFSVLGKRWNGMIVSSLGGGPSTFVALRRAVAGISDTVLSDRLAELAETGLVARTVDAGPPITVSYALTASGEGLLPILDQLGQWASANLAERAH